MRGRQIFSAELAQKDMVNYQILNQELTNET